MELAELEFLLGPTLSRVYKQEEMLRQPTLGDPGLSTPLGAGGIPVMLTGEHPSKLVGRRAESLSCTLSCPEITKGIK